MNVHYLYNRHFLEPNRVTQKRAIIGNQTVEEIIGFTDIFLFHRQRKPITTDTNTSTAKRMSMCKKIYEMKVTYNSSCYLNNHYIIIRKVVM